MAPVGVAGQVSPGVSGDGLGAARAGGAARAWACNTRYRVSMAGGAAESWERVLDDDDDWRAGGA